MKKLIQFALAVWATAGVCAQTTEPSAVPGASTPATTAEVQALREQVQSLKEMVQALQQQVKEQQTAATEKNNESKSTIAPTP